MTFNTKLPFPFVIYVHDFWVEKGECMKETREIEKKILKCISMYSYKGK